MTLTTSVDQRMVLNYEKSKLKDLLRQRLNECGCRAEVRLLCRNAIKENRGSINIDQIVQEVKPKARERVSYAVKKELLMKTKANLAAKKE